MNLKLTRDLKRNAPSTPVHTADAASSSAPPRLSIAEKLIDFVKSGFTSSTDRQNASSRLRAVEDGVQSTNQVNASGTVTSRTEAASVRATPDALLGALTGPWTAWWKGSSLDQRSDDGKRFTIRPLGPSYLGLPGPSVSIQLGEPQRTVGDDGRVSIRMPMRFSGDFTSDPISQSYIEVTEQPDGSSAVSFNWNDVRVTGALKKFPGLGIGLHTRALEGDTPGRDGSGLEGLVRMFAAP